MSARGPEQRPDFSQVRGGLVRIETTKGQVVFVRPVGPSADKQLTQTVSGIVEELHSRGGRVLEPGVEVRTKPRVIGNEEHAGRRTNLILNKDYIKIPNTIPNRRMPQRQYPKRP